MQSVLDVRWGGKHGELSSSNNQALNVAYWDSIRGIHRKLQRKCGHRGVGRDRYHTDNRKGPSPDATYLFRQLEKTYADAANAGFHFPPPDATIDSKV